MGDRLEVGMACLALEVRVGKVAWAFLVHWVLVLFLDLCFMLLLQSEEGGR